MGLSGDDLARLGPAAKRQILAKLGQAEKNSKYHNETAMRGNIRFDSQKEARRYDELMILLKAGKIQNLKLQPQFTLQESYITPDGERIRARRYVADFSYARPTEPDQYGEVYLVPVVEDVKSEATKTALYRSKKKEFQAQYGIRITEV